MEFKVNSKLLEKTLTKVIPAIPSRTATPILENFLFDLKDGLLSVYATDTEMVLKSSLNVVTEQNLRVVIPARLLYDIVRSLKETTLLFEVSSNGKINLKTDNGLYTISYLQADNFPEIPTFIENNVESDQIGEVIMSGVDLKKAIDQTSFAISKEDMRPAMMGLLMEFVEEGMRLVTTDGHRLVNILKKNIKLGFNQQYIIPEKAVAVLTKILEEKDVRILLSSNLVSFKTGDIEFLTRLIGYKYPDYRSVIPMENENDLTIKSSLLLTAIKRMLFFSPASSRKVKFSITVDNLEISAEDIDQGSFAKENITCEYKGEPMDIGFNSLYVNDVISHLQEEEEIHLKLNSPTRAVIIEPVVKKADEDMMMLLMPVRLNN